MFAQLSKETRVRKHVGTRTELASHTLTRDESHYLSRWRHIRYIQALLSCVVAPLLAALSSVTPCLDRRAPLLASWGRLCVVVENASRVLQSVAHSLFRKALSRHTLADTGALSSRSRASTERDDFFRVCVDLKKEREREREKKTICRDGWTRATFERALRRFIPGAVASVRCLCVKKNEKERERDQISRKALGGAVPRPAFGHCRETEVCSPRVGRGLVFDRYDPLCAEANGPARFISFERHFQRRVRIYPW